MQDRVQKPPRMVRKQLLITPEQNTQLGAIAAASSRPESELVREAVDQWLAKQKAGEEDWKKALLSVRGMWKDRTDLDEFYAERRRRRRLRRERMNALMATGRQETDDDA